MSGYAYTPWIWPMLASAVFTGAVGLYLWRRRETAGALPLSLAAMVIAAWCLANAAEISATDFETQRAWFILRDALAMPGVVAAVWFALAYAGFSRWLTRPVVALLVASIIAHLPFYVIDDGRLLWSRIWWDGGVRADLAPLGALFSAYGFGLFLVATAIFVLLFVRSPAHRLPVALILAGQLSIRAAYPLESLNILNVPNLPLVVLAFDFAALMYVIALVRFRIFDLVPIARETIIERMPDAMLVIDTRDRIVDLNEAAARLLRADRSSVLRKPAAVVLASLPAVAAWVAAPVTRQGEITLTGEPDGRLLQVSDTEFTDWQGRVIGRLVVLHDITELRLTQERLVKREKALAVARERDHMARELHDSVGQVLGYVSMEADAMRALLADGRHAETRDQLARLADVARPGDLGRGTATWLPGPSGPASSTPRPPPRRMTYQSSTSLPMSRDRRVPPEWDRRQERPATCKETDRWPATASSPNGRSTRRSSASGTR